MADASTKQGQIAKSTQTMVTVASIVVFVTVFCLFSSHALLNKLGFQDKVINARTTARNELKEDVSAANNLANSYVTFNQSQTNLLGGSVTNPDNDNARIILDALPSAYDYPALTTSIQNLLSNQGVKIDSIGGTDESATVASSAGAPVAMPFTFSIDGPYQNIQNVITNEFEKSIRPFQILTMDFSGNQSDITLSVTAQTYYQPASKFTITQQKVQ